ncbi:hypothetical protein [Variovorax paradoxus]|uniref:hypothetical protein n=1 Tax=Variovorax paradoxus TaxID=34073 RepID=UPI003ED1437C
MVDFPAPDSPVSQMTGGGRSVVVEAGRSSGFCNCSGIEKQVWPGAALQGSGSPGVKEDEGSQAARFLPAPPVNNKNASTAPEGRGRSGAGSIALNGARSGNIARDLVERKNIPQRAAQKKKG